MLSEYLFREVRDKDVKILMEVFQICSYIRFISKNQVTLRWYNWFKDDLQEINPIYRRISIWVWECCSGNLECSGLLRSDDMLTVHSIMVKNAHTLFPISEMTASSPNSSLKIWNRKMCHQQTILMTVVHNGYTNIANSNVAASPLMNIYE
jgi:hypothetical protein